MIVDRKSLPWIFGCATALVIASLLFAAYASRHRGALSGGSAPGLAFGFAGSAAMLVAMLLALRKRFRAMRLGRAYQWMQAHVWLGLLSYPLIIFHAGGFSWGGTLTQVSMWLFTLVFISGIVGLVIQQTLPSRILREVPAETIFEQIEHLLQEMRDAASNIVQPLVNQQKADDAEIEAGGVATLRARAAISQPLTSFYQQQIVPFLASRYNAASPLASDLSSQEAFSALRSRLPGDLHMDLARLQTIVDERRQLHRQKRLHFLLHGWLLVHVPLSYSLIILGTIHAITAFRYTTP